MDLKAKGFWIGVGIAFAIEALRRLIFIMFLNSNMSIFSLTYLNYAIWGAVLIFWLVTGKNPKLKNTANGVLIGAIAASVLSSLIR
ncbi:MAG: hypothetical protein LBL34_00065 [Clostridiales bacterium]|jgi:hypothetical protein|nr:hypothetical protein [Clostridiales bacterium]